MPKVSESRFWQPLLSKYSRSPSVALCRIPEVEYLSSVPLVDPVVDHCCGDGYIADLCYPGRKMEAGVDLSAPALELARQRGIYNRIVQTDAGKSVPLDTGSVSTVLNNSGIEHIDNIAGALSEVGRILKGGGIFHFTVLNSRYFDWWPRSSQERDEYIKYQPYHTIWDEKGWTEALNRAGFAKVVFRDYFPKPTAQVLADYDYRYSAFYIKRRFSPGVAATMIAPASLLESRWRDRFGGLEWVAPAGQGAGFLVSATRAG